jgi:tetraacyldisaccharide 4'-kinase
MSKPRDLLIRIWNDRRADHCNPLLFFLFLLSLVYGSLMGFRSLLYRFGLLRARRLPCPVVSVGNITVGGTGKTPAVVALAKHFRGKGCHPAVLSRGYGGKGKGAARVVSDGKAILAEVDEAGDEPLLIAQAREGVAVVTGRDRFKSGEYAIRNLGADILFLDDAFQHAALARDFDIVLLNAKAPCGNGFLIPRGPLREKAAALKRADAVVLSGADPKRAEAAFCLNRLREIRPGTPVLGARYRSKLLIKNGTEIFPVEFLAGKKVFAFCGIANPGAFRESIEAAGAEVVAFSVYPDHHRYSQAEIGQIGASYAGSGAQIMLSTEKDGVKLKKVPEFFRDIFLLRIELDFLPEGELERLIEGRLRIWKRPGQPD